MYVSCGGLFSVSSLYTSFSSLSHSHKCTQHSFVTDFNERVVRIQLKDQIDIMKRKKIAPTEQYSSGEGEGDSLDPPTIKKPGGQ